KTGVGESIRTFRRGGSCFRRLFRSRSEIIRAYCGNEKATHGKRCHEGEVVRQELTRVRPENIPWPHESNSRHRKCDLSAPTPSTTARCSAPTASTTGSLLEALALRCAALPVLCLPVHLARSGTPVLRRLSRAFGTLCPLLSTGLIGTTTTGFLVVLCLLLRVLRIRGTIYRVPTAVVV